MQSKIKASLVLGTLIVTSLASTSAQANTLSIKDCRDFSNGYSQLKSGKISSFDVKFTDLNCSKKVSNTLQNFIDCYLESSKVKNQNEKSELCGKTGHVSLIKRSESELQILKMSSTNDNKSDLDQDLVLDVHLNEETIKTARKYDPQPKETYNPRPSMISVSAATTTTYTAPQQAVEPVQNTNSSSSSSSQLSSSMLSISSQSSSTSSSSISSSSVNCTDTTFESGCE